MRAPTDELTQPQRDRLAYIELRVRFLGEVRRQDLFNRFGIQAAAATRDLATYKELVPGNIDYDSKEKVYIRSELFRPLFDFAPSRVLTWLAHGYGDNEPVRHRALLPAEVPTEINEPTLEALSVVTRAIHRKCAIQVTYRALSSGMTTREIVPFALADGGSRWHVRAFDRRTREFRDFVLARIADARFVDGGVQEEERPDQDIQWNRIVELELVPHPANMRNPDTIEAEYQMTDGCRVARVRAALVGYMLRRWNVDCTPDHRLRGGENHLWLRNRQALYGVANLVLAPGYAEAGLAEPREGQ
nr:WYL domain-containing protein [uncultured Roseateles sp.]